MSTSVSSVQGQLGQQTTTGQDAFNQLDLDSFLKMLVAEMQNQDPMNPMDNSQILQQISQVKAIASNERLTETLDAVHLGQNVATANSLLSHTILGLSDNNKQVSGMVDGVSIEDGKVKLYVGGEMVDLKNVAAIAS